MTFLALTPKLSFESRFSMFASMVNSRKANACSLCTPCLYLFRKLPGFPEMQILIYIEIFLENLC